MCYKAIYIVYQIHTLCMHAGCRKVGGRRSFLCIMLMRGDDLVVMGIETYKYNNPAKDYVNDILASRSFFFLLKMITLKNLL